jgi:hypothetical protein
MAPSLTSNGLALPARIGKVVADQLAAAIGEDRRTAHRTCALLMVLLADGHLTRRLFAGMLRQIAALLSPAGCSIGELIR